MNLKKRLDDLEQRLNPPPTLAGKDAPLCYTRNEPMLHLWWRLMEKDPEKRKAMEADDERRGLCSCKTCREYRAAAAERPHDPELSRLIRLRAGLVRPGNATAPEQMQ